MDIRFSVLTRDRNSSVSIVCKQLIISSDEAFSKLAPSFGSNALGSTLFQCLLWTIPTCQTNSVATSFATTGGSSGGASPTKIRATAFVEAHIDSMLYPPCFTGIRLTR